MNVANAVVSSTRATLDRLAPRAVGREQDRSVGVGSVVASMLALMAGLAEQGARSMAVMRYVVKDVDAAVALYAQRVGFTLKQQFGPNILAGACEK